MTENEQILRSLIDKHTTRVLAGKVYEKASDEYRQAEQAFFKVIHSCGPFVLDGVVVSVDDARVSIQPIEDINNTPPEF